MTDKDLTFSSLNLYLESLRDDKKNSFFPRYQVKSLVEFWDKKPTVGLILESVYDFNILEFNYTVLANNETHVLPESRLFNLGKSKLQGISSEEIVMVQPMTRPSASVFYLDFEYDITKIDKKEEKNA